MWHQPFADSGPAKNVFQANLPRKASREGAQEERFGLKEQSRMKRLSSIRDALSGKIHQDDFLR